MTVAIWFRQDLRLQDNAALSAAINSGEPVVPVYILDDVNSAPWVMGGATRWWLHLSLQKLDAALQKRGFAPLVYLNGDAAKLLPAFMEKHDISAVYWNRRYEPWAMERDKRIKEKLGKAAHSFAGFLLFEPWTIMNKTGGPYKVFTPYSKAVLDVADAGILPPEKGWPKAKHAAKAIKELSLDDLGLMPRIKWYEDMAREWTPGEDGAQKRLSHAVETIAAEYKNKRDFPVIDGVSKLSPYLHFGEVSPRQVWHAVKQEIIDRKSAGYTQNANGFLRQLIWRDFSWHLLYHDQQLPEREWNPQFRGFKWRHDEKYLDAWRRGQTGYPIVDAGMRQLWQTGWMHNRVRMIVGSFLVKNLLQDWRAGEAWFWDTLVDADLGNNAFGWQWIAGSGADAAPYFRIFNPVLQSRKFDGEGTYIRTYVPELADMPDKYIHTPWEAPAEIRRGIKYPAPIVDLDASRKLALAAYQESKPHDGE